MAAKSSWEPSVILAVLVSCAAASAWWWQQRVARTAGEISVKGESWHRVKEEYPLPQESAETAILPKDVLEAIVKANPFSQKRRVAPPPESEEANGSSAGPAAPPAPKFAYKGGVNLGKRQRAIVEDIANHKTYFLEVGQEVAGFKVLDIDDKRVLLSDLRAKTELEVLLATTASSAPQKDAPPRPGAQGVSTPSPAQTGQGRSP